jgi:hypothetical protein
MKLHKNMRQSRREVYACAYDYPQVKAAARGAKVLLDHYLEQGQVYVLWPNGRRVWLSATATVLRFTVQKYDWRVKKQRGGAYE